MFNIVIVVVVVALLLTVAVLACYIHELIHSLHIVEDELDLLKIRSNRFDTCLDSWRDDTEYVRNEIYRLDSRISDLEDLENPDEEEPEVACRDISFILKHLIEIDERIEKRVGSVEEFTGRLLHEYTRNCEHRKPYCQKEYPDKLNYRYDPARESGVIGYDGKTATSNLND